MGKEYITTLAIVGTNADRFLERNGIDPRNFVVGMSSDNEHVVTTALGKVSVAYGVANKGENREVILDCTDAPALQGASYKGKERKVSLGADGIGAQHLRKGVEIVIVTNAPVTVFENSR